MGWWSVLHLKGWFFLLPSVEEKLCIFDTRAMDVVWLILSDWRSHEKWTVTRAITALCLSSQTDRDMATVISWREKGWNWRIREKKFLLLLELGNIEWMESAWISWVLAELSLQHQNRSGEEPRKWRHRGNIETASTTFPDFLPTSGSIIANHFSIIAIICYNWYKVEGKTELIH